MAHDTDTEAANWLLYDGESELLGISFPHRGDVRLPGPPRRTHLALKVLGRSQLQPRLDR